MTAPASVQKSPPINSTRILWGFFSIGPVHQGQASVHHRIICLRVAFGFFITARPGRDGLKTSKRPGSEILSEDSWPGGLPRDRQLLDRDLSADCLGSGIVGGTWDNCITGAGTRTRTGTGAGNGNWNGG